MKETRRTCYRCGTIFGVVVHPVALCEWCETGGYIAERYGKQKNKPVALHLDGSEGPVLKDRKDKVEAVLSQAQKLDGDEAVQAWRRLCRELGHMTHPEARMPRFNALLHAVWIAASNDQS